MVKKTRCRASNPGWLDFMRLRSRTGLPTARNAGRRVTLAGDPIDAESIEERSSPLCAAVDGFNLHAAVVVPQNDRVRLEQLLRYAARPPFAIDRLEQLPDGRLSYRLKTPWRDGTTHAVFTPLEFIERLAALIPTPRAHLVRFSGVPRSGRKMASPDRAFRRRIHFGNGRGHAFF